jgi:hypothetical protein
MGVEILVPIGIAGSQWTGFPITDKFQQHLNVDETMAAKDTSDWNRQAGSDLFIKHIAGKLTNLGTINYIKLAMNAKQYTSQGVGGLRLNVWLNGSRVVPETEINMQGLIAYTGIQVVWLANAFLAPWVGLTGQQWNDEIDANASAAQYWLKTFLVNPAFPPDDPDIYGAGP